MNTTATAERGRLVTTAANARSRSLRLSVSTRNKARGETASLTIQLSHPDEVIDKVLQILSARFPLDAFFHVIANSTSAGTNDDVLAQAMRNPHTVAQILPEDIRAQWLAYCSTQQQPAVATVTQERGLYTTHEETGSAYSSSGARSAGDQTAGVAVVQPIHDTTTSMEANSSNLSLGESAAVLTTPAAILNSISMNVQPPSSPKFDSHSSLSVIEQSIPEKSGDSASRSSHSHSSHSRPHSEVQGIRMGSLMATGTAEANTIHTETVPVSEVQANAEAQVFEGEGKWEEYHDDSADKETEHSKSGSASHNDDSSFHEMGHEFTESALRHTAEHLHSSNCLERLLMSDISSPTYQQVVNDVVNETGADFSMVNAVFAYSRLHAEFQLWCESLYRPPHKPFVYRSSPLVLPRTVPLPERPLNVQPEVRMVPLPPPVQPIVETNSAHTLTLAPGENHMVHTISSPVMTVKTTVTVDPSILQNHSATTTTTLHRSNEAYLTDERAVGHLTVTSPLNMDATPLKGEPTAMSHRLDLSGAPTQFVMTAAHAEANMDQATPVSVMSASPLAQLSQKQSFSVSGDRRSSAGSSGKKGSLQGMSHQGSTGTKSVHSNVAQPAHVSPSNADNSAPHSTHSKRSRMAHTEKSLQQGSQSPRSVQSVHSKTHSVQSQPAAPASVHSGTNPVAADEPCETGSVRSDSSFTKENVVVWPVLAARMMNSTVMTTQSAAVVETERKGSRTSQRATMLETERKGSRTSQRATMLETERKGSQGVAAIVTTGGHLANITMESKNIEDAVQMGGGHAVITGGVRQLSGSSRPSFEMQIEVVEDSMSRSVQAAAAGERSPITVTRTIIYPKGHPSGNTVVDNVSHAMATWSSVLPEQSREIVYLQSTSPRGSIAEASRSSPNHQMAVTSRTLPVGISRQISQTSPIAGATGYHTISHEFTRGRAGYTNTGLRSSSPLAASIGHDRFFAGSQTTTNIQVQSRGVVEPTTAGLVQTSYVPYTVWKASQQSAPVSVPAVAAGTESKSVTELTKSVTSSVMSSKYAPGAPAEVSQVPMSGSPMNGSPLAQLKHENPNPLLEKLAQHWTR